MGRGRLAKVHIREQRKDLNSFLKSAEHHKAYAVESLIQGLAYVTADDEFAIVTCSGNVRMSTDNAEKMCYEILGILKDRRHIKNCYRGQI